MSVSVDHYVVYGLYVPEEVVRELFMEELNWVEKKEPKTPFDPETGERNKVEEIPRSHWDFKKEYEYIRDGGQLHGQRTAYRVHRPFSNYQDREDGIVVALNGIHRDKNTTKVLCERLDIEPKDIEFERFRALMIDLDLWNKDNMGVWVVTQVF